MSGLSSRVLPRTRIHESLHVSPVSVEVVTIWKSGRIDGLRLCEVERAFRQLRRVYEEARTESLESRSERQRIATDRQKK